METSIVLTMVQLNRKENLIRNIELQATFMDRIMISDGGSTDSSLEWLKENASRYNIETVVKKQVRLQYGKHTPTARNPYLERLNPSKDKWMLCVDDDEFLEEEACQKLKHFASKAEELGFNEIRFQARDLWTYTTGETYDNLAEYWKQDMFVRIVSGMTYLGDTHSGLYRPGITPRFAKAQGTDGRFLHYRHEKTEERMWQNSTYLYWTTCGVAQNRTDDPSWKQFHELMSKHGYYDWHEFNKAMDKGNLPSEITDWFIDHKEDENPEALSYFIHYYIFKHPEENIQKISCERHNRYTCDYLTRAQEKKNQ